MFDLYINYKGFIEKCKVGLSAAVGLGGVNETKKLVEILEEKSTEKIIVMALDNDKAGRRATGKFIEELAEAELEQKYIVISNLYGRYKDANEFFIRYGDDIITVVGNIRCTNGDCPYINNVGCCTGDIKNCEYKKQKNDAFINYRFDGI